jgi:ubiquinone/menaquinone biosynthesis C-methylase UbiE
MNQFYREVIDELLDEHILDTRMNMLIVAGGETDWEVFYRRGFKSVVISNLDARMNGSEFAPFEWSFQDAENLTYEDNAFDFCVVHSGLHHCYSPHRALLEMYRVAESGLLLFEPYDNLLTRLGVRLKVGQDYEHAAVYYNDLEYGGVRNTWMPNYVYRWTDGEIVQTINSFAPHGRHYFKFVYKTRLPVTQLKGRKNPLFYYAALVALPIVKTLSSIFPRQVNNNFAAIVLKPKLPQDLHPWLTWEEDGVKLNKQWLTNRYKASR